MTIDWKKVRHFVQRRALFCATAISRGDSVHQFPIGSLRIGPGGQASFYEVFARPGTEGAQVSFLAVDLSPLFWIKGFWKGTFPHPPALRLLGTLGERREITEQERQHWFKRVGWLLKTKGGQALWSNPRWIREVHLQEVKGVRLGSMTRGLDAWLGDKEESLAPA